MFNCLNKAKFWIILIALWSGMWWNLLADDGGFKLPGMEGIEDKIKDLKAQQDTLDEGLTMEPVFHGDIEEIYKPILTENKAYSKGEKLTYSVKYGFIAAGEAVMEVEDIVEEQGRQCYHITSKARTGKAFSPFFKVDDKLETYIDVDSLYTWRFEKHLREGGFKADEQVFFDQYNHEAIYPTGIEAKYELRVDIPPRVQDALSILYYTRAADLIPGQDVYIDNHTDKKNYLIRILVLRHERVKVPHGKYDTIKCRPIMASPSIFKQEGEIIVWASNDDHHYPVKMTSSIVIGKIGAHLKKVEAGENN